MLITIQMEFGELYEFVCLKDESSRMSEEPFDILPLANKPARLDLWNPAVHGIMHNSSLVDLYLWNYCAVDEWWMCHFVTKEGVLLSQRWYKYHSPLFEDSDSDDELAVLEDKEQTTVRLMFVHMSQTGEEKYRHAGSLLLSHGSKHATFFEPNGAADKFHGCYLETLRGVLSAEWSVADLGNVCEPQRLYQSDIGLCALWNLAFLSMHRNRSSLEQIASFFASLGQDRAKNLMGNLMRRVWRKEDKETYRKLRAKLHDSAVSVGS